MHVPLFPAEQRQVDACVFEAQHSLSSELKDIQDYVRELVSSHLLPKEEWGLNSGAMFGISSAKTFAFTVENKMMPNTHPSFSVHSLYYPVIGECRYDPIPGLVYHVITMSDLYGYLENDTRLQDRGSDTHWQSVRLP